MDKIWMFFRNLFRNLFCKSYGNSLITAILSVRGTDVSYWNANGTTNDLRSWINWETMKLKTHFTIIRATNGLSDDTQCPRNCDEATKKGAIFGIYAYINPAYSLQGQADKIINAIKTYKPKLGGWLDCETTGNLTPVALKNYLKELIRLVELGTGEPIGIYCRGEWWNVNVARDIIFSTKKLWIARYSNTLAGPWSDGRYAPLDWVNNGKTWTFWQWSQTGIGSEFGCPLPPYGDDDIDLNYYNGSYEQFCIDFNLNVDSDLAEIYAALEDHEQRIVTLESITTNHTKRIELLELETEVVDYITVQPLPEDKAVGHVIDYLNDKQYPVMKKATPLVRYDFPEVFNVHKELIRGDSANYWYRIYNTEIYVLASKVKEM